MLLSMSKFFLIVGLTGENNKRQNQKRPLADQQNQNGGKKSPPGKEKLHDQQKGGTVKFYQPGKKEGQDGQEQPVGRSQGAGTPAQTPAQGQRKKTQNQKSNGKDQFFSNPVIQRPRKNT
jgi:hypothetical protein